MFSLLPFQFFLSFFSTFWLTAPTTFRFCCLFGKWSVQMKTSSSFYLIVFWIFEYNFIFLYSRFLLVIHFIHISVYIYVNPNFQIFHTTTTTPPLSPFGGHTWILHICVSIQSCKPVHLYHLSRLHIYAFIYVICFSLSDWLHSVWQSLDPSTPVPMNQLTSFLWLSNSPCYICTSSSLSIRLWMGI